MIVVRFTDVVWARRRCKLGKDDGSLGLRSLHHATFDDLLVDPILLCGRDTIHQIPKHNSAIALLLQDAVFSNSELSVRRFLAALYAWCHQAVHSCALHIWLTQGDDQYSGGAWLWRAGTAHPGVRCQGLECSLINRN